MTVVSPPAAPSEGGSRRLTFIGLGALVVLLGVLLVVERGGDGEAEDGSGAREVFLTPAAAVGPDAFAEGGDVNDAPAPPPRPRVERTVARGQGSKTALRSVEGTEPGLYGGARGASPCNTGLLATKVTGDTSRSAAWARAAGVTVDGIRTYLNGLTPLVLRADTRATEYMFRDGSAAPRQVVLQSGTSVLVDAFGAPAVRCASGNPLQAPEPARGGADYSGERWGRFDPTRALIVTRGPAAVDQFVVVDLTGPGYFVRPVGSTADETAVADGHVFLDTVCDLFPEECRPPGVAPPDPVTGPDGAEVALKIDLRWFSTADLDLAVTDPSGATVRYDAPSVESGGTLSADTNGGCRAPTSAPVETVTWPVGQAPPGDYEVTVSYYDACPGGSGAQPYALAVSGPGVTVSGESSDGDQAASDQSSLRLIVHVRAAGEPVIVGRQTTEGTLGGVGDSASTSVSVGTPALGKLPGPVQNLTAEITDKGVVVVQWTPNADPAFGAATSFATLAEATIDGEVRGSELTVTNPYFSQPGLPPGVTITYTVVAENTTGPSEPVSVTITTPEAPEEPPQKTPEEMLKERCDALYGPPPPPFEQPSNMMWTLCMHDPTTTDPVVE